jgi:hypothetical protein
MTGFTPFMIFVASFVNKKSYWRLGRLDIICGTLSIIGILLWYFTKTGNTAIVFSIFADGLAAIPTIVKSYYAPETEDYKVYFLGASAAALTLLTIKVWNFAYVAWPLYILLVTLLLSILIKFRLGLLISAK